MVCIVWVNVACSTVISLVRRIEVVLFCSHEVSVCTVDLERLGMSLICNVLSIHFLRMVVLWCLGSVYVVCAFVLKEREMDVWTWNYRSF